MDRKEILINIESIKEEMSKLNALIEGCETNLKMLKYTLDDLETELENLESEELENE